ncbi:hypothetical protein TNCV_4969591 [Trichonephila clavipes]|nr:hypothetical protein TNCV_4969591 [Trichonephila clavipes]
MRPLENAGKNGWTMADFSITMPAKSPDPSPIKHACDMMGKRMHLPGNIDDLARQLEQIWQEISQEIIRMLYHSMSGHVAACI